LDKIRFPAYKRYFEPVDIYHSRLAGFGNHVADGELAKLVGGNKKSVEALRY
jgi:hypothetical protein